jgi:hypothetical protein
MGATNTFKNDLLLLQSVYVTFKEAAPKLSSIPDLSLSLTIEPILPAITAKFGARGGNSLGLNPASDVALVLRLISATWDTEADDAEIEIVSKLLNARIVEAAKARVLFQYWV